MFDIEIPTIFGVHIPKLAIVIVMGVVGYYLASFIMKVFMSGFAGMASIGGGSDRPGPKSRRATTTAGSAAVAFERSIVVASGADWEQVQAVNAALEKLQERKAATLPRQGHLQTSKSAWLVALFEQAILHRIVVLVAGAMTMWDARNPLGAALCARGLLESGALVLDMERHLSRLAETGKQADIDTYVQERAFVMEPGGWIEQARAARPVDVLKLVGEADSVCPGMRFCYDRLSEIAAPEALGQYAVFGAIDKSGTSAEFRDDESLEPSTYRLILDAARIVVPVAAALESIDALTLRVVAFEKA